MKNSISEFITAILTLQKNSHHLKTFFYVVSHFFLWISTFILYLLKYCHMYYTTIYMKLIHFFDNHRAINCRNFRRFVVGSSTCPGTTEWSMKINCLTDRSIIQLVMLIICHSCVQFFCMLPTNLCSIWKKARQFFSSAYTTLIIKTRSLKNIKAMLFLGKLAIYCSIVIDLLNVPGKTFLVITWIKW